jgi:hypothetical protein
MDADVVADALHIQPVERLHRASGLAFGGAEGREVVPPYQDLRGLVHGGGVQRALHQPGPIPLERQRRPPVDDAIDIMASPRRGAGVEAVRHLARGEHTHRPRLHMRVHGVAHGIAAPVAAEIHMRHLMRRVHPASVRPAPWMRTTSPLKAVMAASSTPCTEAPDA